MKNPTEIYKTCFDVFLDRPYLTIQGVKDYAQGHIHLENEIEKNDDINCEWGWNHNFYSIKIIRIFERQPLKLL